MISPVVLVSCKIQVLLPLASTGEVDYKKMMAAMAAAVMMIVMSDLSSFRRD